MQRLFLLALAFIVVLGAALGTLLYVSLIPFFHEIGLAMTGLLILGMICAAFMMVSFTFNKIGSWGADRRHKQLQSRVIVAGDIVALPQEDGTLIHLSAMHEAAKVPPLLPAGKPQPQQEAEQPITDDETIIELWEKGLSLRTIEKALGIPYHRVQKVTSAEKSRRSQL